MLTATYIFNLIQNIAHIQTLIVLSTLKGQFTQTTNKLYVFADKEACVSYFTLNTMIKIYFHTHAVHAIFTQPFKCVQ